MAEEFWGEEEKKGLLSQLIKQLIELNVKAVEAMTKMHTKIDEGLREEALMHSTISTKTDEIQANFKNGFRSEIRNTINSSKEEIIDSVSTWGSKIDKILDSTKLNTILLGTVVAELLAMLAKMIFWS